MTLRTTAVALALSILPGPAPAAAEVAPSEPFSIYVFARGELPENQPPDGKLPYSEKKLVDSAGDVRSMIGKYYPEWFRVVEGRNDAEIVLEITHRGQSQESALYDSAVQELVGHVKVLSDYEGPIKFTFKSGAGGGWRMVARRLVGVLRDYCSKSLASLEQQRAGRQQAAALGVELEALQALEGTARETFRGLADRLKSEELEAAAAAQIVEADIVEPMAGIRARLEVLLDDTQTVRGILFVRTLCDYVRLREAAWTLTAEALRENDGAKSRLANEKHQQAQALLAELTPSDGKP